MSTQKSTQTSTQTPTTDVYSMYKQNVQKYFENISKITPQYFQAITHLQEECLKATEKTINASGFVQQEFAKKTGISTEIPRAAKNVICVFIILNVYFLIFFKMACSIIQ